MDAFLGTAGKTLSCENVSIPFSGIGCNGIQIDRLADSEERGRSFEDTVEPNEKCTPLICTNINLPDTRSFAAADAIPTTRN